MRELKMPSILKSYFQASFLCCSPCSSQVIAATFFPAAPSSHLPLLQPTSNTFALTTSSSYRSALLLHVTFPPSSPIHHQSSPIAFLRTTPFCAASERILLTFSARQVPSNFSLPGDWSMRKGLKRELSSSDGLPNFASTLLRVSLRSDLDEVQDILVGVELGCSY